MITYLIQFLISFASSCDIQLAQHIVVIDKAKTIEFFKNPKFNNCENKSTIIDLLVSSKGEIHWKDYSLNITPTVSKITPIIDILTMLFPMTNTNERIGNIILPSNLTLLMDSPEQLQILPVGPKHFTLLYNNIKISGMIQLEYLTQVYELDIERLNLSSRLSQSDFIKKNIYVQDPNLYIYPSNLFDYYQVNKSLTRAQLLTQYDIKAITLIRPGDIVKLNVRYKNIHIETSAQARGNGVFGDSIHLVNMKTQKDIYAKVTGPKLAIISSDQGGL